MRRLLIDNQLPPALARFLTERGLDATHVSDIGLESASDAIIWRHAETHGMVIVSKDDDFRLRSDQFLKIPPQVVWVRLRNCRKQPLLEAFDRVLESLVSAIQSGERLIEIR